MPEYLAPGVFVEEVPARLKAIEGVSTSTAAFVGPAERGSVPGFPLPYDGEAAGFVVPRDAAPRLVTSFADFTRVFGRELVPDALDNWYLARAVRAFFDNGGKRCYVARVVDLDAAGNPTALAGTVTVAQDAVLQLAERVAAGATTVRFNSLRGVSAAAAGNLDNRIAFFRHDPALLHGEFLEEIVVDTYDSTSGTVTLPVGDTVATALDPGDVYGVAGPVMLDSDSGSAGTLDLVSTARVAAGGTIGFYDRATNALEQQVRVVSVDSATQVTIGASLAANLTAADLYGVPGVRLALANDAASGATQLELDSLQGVSDARGANAISFFDSATDALVETVFVQAIDYDAAPLAVDLVTPVQAAAGLAAASLYGVPQLTDTGPRFHARTPGAWSDRVAVSILNADRGPVRVTQAATAGQNTLAVQSVGSFYNGAIVEIDSGTERRYHEVVEILPGRRLELAAPIGMAVSTAGFARVIEIDVTLRDESAAASAVETFRGLTWNPRNRADVRRRHYATVINARSALVYVQPPGVDDLTGGEAADLVTQPRVPGGVRVNLNGGFDGNPPGDADYVGVDAGPGARSGIQSLQDVEEARIVLAPGRTGQVVQNALVTQCERLRYRFAVLDGQRDANTVTGILTHRNAYDTSYAAYYQPWLQVVENEQRLLVPPSGHVAGIYARTDVERGVYKAPANEVVRGITDLAMCITTGEQEVLNPRGVNAIRRLEGRGIRVWGARTLSSDPEFRYVNVRRFLIFLEASLDRGTQWAVFEPNSPETWQRVVNSVTAFLHTQWRDGALFGRTPEQAFFVRCDETTMTVDDVQNGRLICEIGVAIVRPAEFVIFRIEQITGFGEEA